MGQGTGEGSLCRIRERKYPTHSRIPQCLQEVEIAERARQQRHLVAYTDKRETKKNKLDECVLLSRAITHSACLYSLLSDSSICKLLRDTDEWTDEEIACFWDGSWGLAEWAAKDEMPKASPQSDPEGESQFSSYGPSIVFHPLR